MSKKKIIIILITFVILIAVIALSIFLLNNNNNKNMNIKSVEEENLRFIDITDDLTLASYNGKAVSIEIKPDKVDESIKHLYINKKDVYKTDQYNQFIEKVYQFDEYILMISNGIEENKIKIYIYKYDGTFIKEIRDLIIDNMKISHYQVFDKYIDLKGMRLMDGSSFIYKGETIDICDNKLLEDKKIDDNITVMADFRLDYDIDNGFNVKMNDKSQITLKYAQTIYCLKEGE